MSSVGTTLIFLVSVLAAGATALAEGFIRPAPLGPGVSEGEVLLSELNCIRCHTASDTVQARLDSPGGPALGATGLRLTPQWIRTWLNNPQAAKPGTAMPDVLHGLDASARTQTVDDLVHYLVSVEPKGQEPGATADKARAEAGRRMFHSVGCVACHAPDAKEENTTAEGLKRAQDNSVPLGELASKYSVGELARFLRDPVAFHTGGRMPSSGLSGSEAVAIATYLLRGQLAVLGPQSRLSQVQYEYFEADFDHEPEWSKLTPKSTGSTPTVTIPGQPPRNDNFGYRFTGVIHIAKAGQYRFSTTSDDSSRLYIDEKMVVDNGGEHAPQEKRSEAIELAEGDHSLMLTFYNRGAGYELKVQWSGPGFKRQDVPETVLGHYGLPMAPLNEEKDFAVDPAKAARGKEAFVKLNCAACHQLTDGSAIIAAGSGVKAFDALKNASAGCLADAVPATAASYTLGASQKAALRGVLAQAGSLSQPLDAAALLNHRLTQLNCYACHNRENVGGPGASGKADWFKIVGEADLGEEGKMPPHLNGVGAKLKPEWLAKLLNEGPKVRPYMAARMPAFGARRAAELQPALLKADRRADAPAAPEITDRDVKLGWKLVGQGGLGCVACHTFSTHASLGVPALGLDRMYERVTWDWFRRYLPDPAALRPGTRMPTFWPDGQAVNKDILAGNPDAQIKAIYAFLSRGAQGDVPAGLVRGRKEIMVTNEPVIYRNFIEGGGSRAVGVGYPEHANLAFDANNDRLAMIWQGSFIDGSRHSTDRGTGYEPPLGDHIVKLPEGAPFAMLASPTDPWPTVSGKTAGYHFKGYHLDAKRRPTFYYSFGAIEVEDAPMPKTGEIDLTFVRRIKLTGEKPAQPVWYRAAVGEIQERPDGSYLVDGKLQLRFSETGKPRIVGKELRVPVTFSTAFVEELTW